MPWLASLLASLVPVLPLSRTMQNWDKKQTLLMIGGGLLLALPAVALAQDLNALQLPVIPSGDLTTVLGRVLQSILGVIGVIAFFYLLYAGFTYATAGGDPAKTKAAMGSIVNVAIGIIIIALSYVLLRYLIRETSEAGGVQNTNQGQQTNTGSGGTVARPRATTNSSSN